MERKIIDWLKQTFPARYPLSVGIGDDAAVIDIDARQIVVTTDAVVEGVHFEIAKHSWRRIGHKAVAVNLSDLAAMGAVPLAIVITLVLPQGTVLNQVKELYAGISNLCQRWRIAIAGGDTNFSLGPLTISITALGILEPNRTPWLCRGAQIGDDILVSGSLGGSILGKHMDFEPRCDLAREIASKFQVHAATDVSDGLLFNLGVILRSSGCGALLELGEIPISPAAREMADHRSSLDHALYDGEDFELVVVVSPEQAARMLADEHLSNSLTRIGRTREQPGILGRQADRSEKILEVRGYSHGQSGELP